MKYEACPVCGYDEMPYPPVPENICPCCGTQFGFDDHYHSPQELRSAWIEKDFPFFSDTRRPPKDWSPYRQLFIAEHGIDLISHPRMITDEDYRYAVIKAFSEVHIAKQLKVLRENRKEPLTQRQLAEKADMKQSRISELEGMDYSSWSISTLQRLARALGVGFEYSFTRWSELVPKIVSGLGRETLLAPSFEDELAFHLSAHEPAPLAAAPTARLPAPLVSPEESPIVRAAKSSTVSAWGKGALLRQLSTQAASKPIGA
jgi:transcriptional regulator with XRE-family HTH domain